MFTCTKFQFGKEENVLIFFFPALAAVVIIQTWFRRRKALFEIRRKTAWTIYQNIEYAGEQDQLKVKSIFFPLNIHEYLFEY